MPNRAPDWFAQAEHELEIADELGRSGHDGWACFMSHQAAEKAVKALHHRLGQESWGHVLVRLLGALPASILLPAGLVDKARVLDTFYVPTRYPNGHSEGAPFEHYGPLQSQEAIRYAREIVEFVRPQMA